MGKKSVVKTYTGIREDNLIKNNGKYRMYDKPLGMPIGLTTDVYYNEKGKPQQINKYGLLGYTYDIDGENAEYAKKLNEDYGRNVDDVIVYYGTNIKPTFSVNDYEGHGDYVSYIGEIYGKQETYAGHLMGLIGVRDGYDNAAIDIFPNAEGKTFADTINEILQYTDIQYAMEGDKVGIIRNIDVAKALGGVITTNVNNYSGKDTRLGMISNQLYAKTLSRAAHFNSLRRTKYITPELDKLYGNNLSNVYSLSSLFLLADGQPRLIEPVSDSFVKEYEGNDIKNYLIKFIPEYDEKQQEIQEWNVHDRYFGFTKSIENEENFTRRFNPNLVDEPKMVVSDMTKPSTTYSFYEEGDLNNGNAFKSEPSTINTIDGFQGKTIAIKKECRDVLNVTNKLFKNRLFDTLVARFHTSNDKENTLSQSAVHPIFGLSKGRNLLTKSAWEDGKGKKVNGYDNPYCRVWTYHNQYSKMKDLIRPFTKNSGDTFMGINELQKDWYSFRNYKGDERLGKYSVLNKNGMVNITPTNNLEVDIKQCMFSIENLAWKDVNISGKGGYRFENGDFVMDYQNTLSEEQRGPNGGRIMWFPPYDIDFQETSSADWHEDVFIGRGEPIYTYTNTRRNGTLSFTLLIDHPSVLNYWMMDKKNTEDPVNDEQTLLRYFAGCEPISPSGDVNAAILRGEFEGGSKEIKPTIPNDAKIIFNTYFPNNYSGVDVQKKSDVIDMLFSGQCVNPTITPTGGTLETFGGTGETLFLGYEMGLNPISTTFFETERTPIKTLVKVMNKVKAEKEYKDATFIEGTKSVSKGEFFENGTKFVCYDRQGGQSDAEKQVCKNIFGEINNISFIKTQPIYCYYNITNNGNGYVEKTEVVSERIDAYAKYLLETMDTFDSISDFYQKRGPQSICRVKKDGEGYDYYISEIEEIDSIIYNDFNVFTNKRDFKKSIWPFGIVKIQRGGSEVNKYIFKNKKGNVKESDTQKTDVNLFVKEGILQTYENKQKFRDSGEICGCIDTKYVYYKLVKLDGAESALNKIKEGLDENTLDKAYEKHMYGSPDEIQSDLDYWGIQYYCVYGNIIEENNVEIIGGAYESKQAYIINEKINMGVAEEIIYEYTIKNDDGEIVKKYIDGNKDGKIDTVEIYAEGVVNEIFKDDDNDTVIDRFRYENNGENVIQYSDKEKTITILPFLHEDEDEDEYYGSMEEYSDTNNDGKLDTLLLVTGVTGEPLLKVIYEIVDGRVICKISGEMGSYEVVDTNNDEKIDELIVYDSIGSIKEKYCDSDYNGKIDKIIEYTSENGISKMVYNSKSDRLDSLEIYDSDDNIKEKYLYITIDGDNWSCEYYRDNKEYRVGLNSNVLTINDIAPDGVFDNNFQYSVKKKGDKYQYTLNIFNLKKIFYGFSELTAGDDGSEIYKSLLNKNQIFRVKDMDSIGFNSVITSLLDISAIRFDSVEADNDNFGNTIYINFDKNFDNVKTMVGYDITFNNDGDEIERTKVVQYWVNKNKIIKFERYDNKGAAIESLTNIVNGAILSNTEEIGGVQVTLNNKRTKGEFQMNTDAYTYEDTDGNGKIDKIKIKYSNGVISLYQFESGSDIKLVQTAYSDGMNVQHDYSKGKTLEFYSKNGIKYKMFDADGKIFMMGDYRWKLHGKGGSVWTKKKLNDGRTDVTATFTLNHSSSSYGTVNVINYLKYIFYFKGTVLKKLFWKNNSNKLQEFDNLYDLKFYSENLYNGIIGDYKQHIVTIASCLNSLKDTFNNELETRTENRLKCLEEVRGYLNTNSGFILELERVLKEGTTGDKVIPLPKNFESFEKYLEYAKEMYKKYNGKSINDILEENGEAFGELKDAVQISSEVIKKIKLITEKKIIGNSFEDVVDNLRDNKEIEEKFTDAQSKYDEMKGKIVTIQNENKIGKSFNEAFDEDTINGNKGYYAYGSVVTVDEIGDAVNGMVEIGVKSELKYKLDKTLKAYAYPHDSSTNDNELSDVRNYIDLKSFGLNSTYEEVKKINPNVTCSFGEFYAAIKNGDTGGTHTDFVLACERAVLKKENPKITEVELNKLINEAAERIKKMASYIKDYKTEVLSMTVTADASAEGNSDANNGLAKNRAETLVRYLNGLGFGGAIATTSTEKATDKGSSDGVADISSTKSKKDRVSTAIIKFGKRDAKNVIPAGSRGSGKDGEFGEDATDFMSGSTNYRRYDDERLFFSMLKEKDSFAYTNLVKKVQYFSPAFHSITPEGFNARLTFLQQCTRQGPTITASEVGTSGSTAANLAFGRAPFCVLRLGDFLNTRIVVKSVNITYPDNMWDLNHDGIGAQFMMAKVTMNIEIIGGSDISAPIKRLQNAVSFNYYANTSIYDNRSDIAQYNGNGTSSDVRTWNPSLKPRQNGVATQTTNTETTQTNS